LPQARLIALDRGIDEIALREKVRAPIIDAAFDSMRDADGRGPAARAACASSGATACAKARARGASGFSTWRDVL
jgi:hypothetical protein